MHAHCSRRRKGFFAGLFDFGFTSFITLKFLRVIYTVLVLVRVSLETVAPFLRIGENTTLMAAAAGGSSPSSGGANSGLPGPLSAPTVPLSGPTPPTGPVL